MSESKKKKIGERVTDTILSVIKAGINHEKSNKRIEKLRFKFNTLPNDHLAQILIKRAVRLTTAEGFASGAGITGCEALVAAPAPEPTHKALAAGGTVALIFSDATFTTKIQMQLVFDLATVYGCSYDKEDEEDVWQIFKAALGLKGTEKAIGYGRVLFVETAKKQFRALLRTGVRKSLQEKLVKLAGQRIAKVLAEKYVMRLIPLANMGIGATINHFITKSVGKWAKTKAKVRTSAFKYIDKLLLLSRENAILSLPVMFYMSTADDSLTDNEAVLYAQVEKRLSLVPSEMDRIRSIVEDDDISGALKKELKQIINPEINRFLFDIALTASAINLVERNSQQEYLDKLSKILELPFDRNELKERIKYFKT